MGGFLTENPVQRVGPYRLSVASTFIVEHKGVRGGVIDGGFEFGP